jgi:hypothetical protein
MLQTGRAGGRRSIKKEVKLPRQVKRWPLKCWQRLKASLTGVDTENLFEKIP